MDRAALDWLFSTAPQALAALVGLIFAGVAFTLGAIDKETGQDDSREDIFKAMKTEIHANMKWLFCLAGISIILDLIFIVFNPIEEGLRVSLNGTFDPYLLMAGIIIFLNIATLLYSLWFIIDVAKPDYFERTVKRLSKDYEVGDVDVKEYVMEYIEMEKALRALPIFRVPEEGRQHPVTEMLQKLKYSPFMEVKDIERLFELTRLRNLIIHGADITRVEKNNIEDLKKYTKKLTELKERL